jgi:hypothetical protein
MLEMPLENQQLLIAKQVLIGGTQLGIAEVRVHSRTSSVQARALR